MSAAMRRIASKCPSSVPDVRNSNIGAGSYRSLSRQCRKLALTSTGSSFIAGHRGLGHPLLSGRASETLYTSTQNVNHPQLVSRRCFAYGKSKDGGSLPLMNEALVKKISDDSSAASPDEIELRLVVEKDPRTPPTSDVVTLRQAIRTSIDLDLDLVEIALNQQPPVVRAVKYDSKVYQANKKKKEARSNKEPGSIMKEFQFRAQTADHDLQRKVDTVRETLKKGHRCKIVVRCRKKFVVENPLGSEQVLEQVLSKIGSAGEKVKAPDTNEEKTQSSVVLISSRGS